MAKKKKVKTYKEKESKIELEGIVEKVFPGAMFSVAVDVNGTKHIVTCSVSGKLRQNYIRIVVGDTVRLEVSPYDLSRGVITWRVK